MNSERRTKIKFLAAALSVCALLAGAGWTEVPGEPSAAAKAPPEILLPPDSPALAWRYDVKLGDWCGGCGSYFYELNSPGLIERRIKEMKDQGYNAIIMSGFHMHNCFLDRWPRIAEYTRQVVTAAHRSGMKVIFHHDVPVLEYEETGLQELVAHPDWLARDIQHDRPTFRSYCIMNPGFRKAYFDRMQKLVRETDLDGVMLDEACFPGAEFCGCEHCRSAFTEATGLVLPSGNTSKVFFNRDDPLWMEWLRWRKRAVGDWWVAMRKLFNAVKPDLCIMLYTTHGGFGGGSAAINGGNDLVEEGRACDFLGTEIMARNVYDSYRPIFAFRKAFASLGARSGMPIWGLVYHLNDPTFAYFGWAMDHINGQTTWMSSIEGEDMGRYLNWPDRMKCRFAKPVSDVAIMYSSNNRDFGKMMGAIPDSLGFSQCLNEAHVQNDFVLDDGILDVQKLSRYKLLVLASDGDMSAGQVQAVRAYVQAGGRLLVTGHTSLLDENGLMQKNFQLADVMGVDYVAKPLFSGPRQISSKADGAALTVPGGVLRITVRTEAEELASVLDADGKPVSPAIVSNQFGKGHCIYVAFQLGSVNCETEMSTGRPQQFAENPEMARLLVRLVKDAAAKPFDFQSVQAPGKVIMAVCRQEAAGKTDLLVHLLNATGAGLKKGEIDEDHKDWKKTGGPFPPLNEDIVYELRAGEVARAYIVSPDYPGERPVTIEQQKNGYLRVTVKKEDLKAYGIVYLQLAR